MTSPYAIEAEDLVKHFGETVAVDGVSFVVPQGSVLGLLGPNGAGKTTAVRMMTTLTRPTSGTARVAGHDVLTDPAAVRRNMGLTGQAATVDELLTAEIVAELRGSVELVMTWPINDLDLLQSTLAIGANGVISDEPTVLRALLSSR